jgi:hypothetical protein
VEVEEAEEKNYGCKNDECGGRGGRKGKQVREGNYIKTKQEDIGTAAREDMGVGQNEAKERGIGTDRQILEEGKGKIT